jgi:hypothetical protein
MMSLFLQIVGKLGDTSELVRPHGWLVNKSTIADKQRTIGNLYLKKDQNSIMHGLLVKLGTVPYRLLCKSKEKKGS